METIQAGNTTASRKARTKTTRSDATNAPARELDPYRRGDEVRRPAPRASPALPRRAGPGYIGCMLTRLANPTVFMRLSGALLPWLAAAAAVLLTVGICMSLTAPPDYQQGETVRIMFLHVP